MRQTTQWTPFFSRGAHPVIVNDLVRESFTLFPSLLGLPEVRNYKRGTTTFFEAKEFEQLSSKIGREIQRDPKKVIRMIRSADTMFVRTLRSIRMYASVDWKKKSADEVLKAVNDVYMCIVPTYVYIYWPLFVDREIGKIIRPYFRKHFGTSWEEKLALVSQNDQWTIQKNYRRAVAQLARRMNSGFSLPYVREKAKAIVTQYDFVGNYLFRYTPYTLSRVLVEMNELRKRNEVKQAETERQGNAAKKIMSSLPARYRKLLDVAVRDSVFRENRLAYYGKMLQYVYPLFQRAAKLLGISYEDFTQITTAELRSGDFSKKELARRSQGFEYAMVHGKVSIRPKASPKEKFRQQGDRVQGTPVFPGKVRGVVQLGDAYSFQYFKSGSVLVTGMTTPDSISYIKRAKAIVADEGGLTAHAALIAREFHIPCIVGTKNATKVFNNGDRVEVDATKGVVRKV